MNPVHGSHFRKWRGRRCWLGIGSGVFAVLALGGLARYFYGSQKALPPAKPMMAVHGGEVIVDPASALAQELRVAPVLVSDLPHYIEAAGSLRPAPGREVNVYPPFTGRLMKLNIRPGQKVLAGQQLAFIVSGNLAQAWADLFKGAAALTVAAQDYERSRKVARVGGKSVKEVQLSWMGLQQARAELERARQTLLAAGVPASAVRGQLSGRSALDCGVSVGRQSGRKNRRKVSVSEKGCFAYGMALRAPIAGEIGSITAGEGQFLNDPSVALMRVTDTSRLWLSAEVPQDFIELMRPGLTLTLRLMGQICSGTMAGAEPDVDSSTRRISLYLSCPVQSDHFPMLRSGMFVTAQIGVPERHALLIPKSALLMNNDEMSVFVETAPNHFRRVRVRVLYDEGRNIRVLSGLSSEQRVVVSGAIYLNDDAWE